MNENKNAHKDIATTPRPQMAASGRLDFISFRIAQKSYTIYKMSPRTTARIMAARHIGKGSDGSKACIVAMAHSIALAVAGSKSIFADLKAWFICRRIMKRASFAELFDCYQKTLMMIPLEDISALIKEAIAEEPPLAIRNDTPVNHRKNKLQKSIVYYCFFTGPPQSLY